MWSVEYQVTTPSCIAMVTSAASSAASSATSSRRQCVGWAPGKLLNSFTVSNALMRWGVVFCKWQQRINAFGAIFGFKKISKR